MEYGKIGWRVPELPYRKVSWIMMKDLFNTDTRLWNQVARF